VEDIICCGGQVVKSGGVRRTALVLQGDVDDAAYLGLKRWDLGSIPNYRANSNNSLITPRFDYIPDKYWKSFDGTGEVYGLINIKNFQKFGRLGESKFDKFDLNDESIIGCNPCIEFGGADKECCNLAEIFVNNCDSPQEMYDCAYLLYKTQKAIACGKYLFEETNKIVHKNLKLGLGVTGVCQKIDVIESWYDEVYTKLRNFDKVYSSLLGVNQSLRLTVIKPSGTLSLLGGATPGVHAGYSKYHIRRVRFDSKDKLLLVLKDAGYHIEPEVKFDGTKNHDLMIVEFPCKFDDKTLVSESMSAIDQMELVKKMQKVWADQAVSVTVYYRPEEVEEIQNWLKNNFDNSIKAISFLLYQDHGFRQAPLEKTTEKEYLEKSRLNNKIENIKSFIEELPDSLECSNGVCPVR
jgi:hypothetical protein